MKELMFAFMTDKSPDQENKGLLKNILKKDESIDQPLEYYEKELEKNPKNPKIWFQKGRVLLRDLKFNEAQESFDRALSLNPVFFEAWFQKGNAYYFQNKYREALMCFKRAELYTSDDPRLLFMQGNVYFELGMIEKCFLSGKKWMKILNESRGSESLSYDAALMRWFFQLTKLFEKYQKTQEPKLRR